MRNNTFDEIAKVLKKGEVFLIFPHIVMDGDALGSANALCLGLRKLGKKANVVIEDSIPKNLKFFAEDVCIDLNDVDFDHDISICVDCSEEKRFPKRGDLFKKAETTICIDHHSTADFFCDYNHIDEKAAATAELVYYLLKSLDVKMDESIAKSIFTGITTDTGNFQYSNTTGETHKIMTELYSICETFNDVSVELYENESFERLALHGKILEAAETFKEGKAIISWVTQKMLKDAGASMEDSEGIVSKLRSIKGVEVAILLRESDEGKIKASLRAKGNVDVGKICKKFQGGGHVKAAGFTVEKSLADVTEIIKKEVELNLG